jgi:Putative zinc-finger
MSECTNGELRDLLPLLVNGGLDAEMLEAVETHVASCTECAEELALLRSLRPALMRGPAIDTQRIAAAVRARTAGSASRSPVRAGISMRWRVAIAAAALLAVSTLSHVMGTHRSSGTQNVAVAPVPRAVAADTPVQEPPKHFAVATPHFTPRASSPTTVTSSGVLDNVSDLSDDDARVLTASLDELSSVPDADPSPGIDPLGASLEDLSAGGR